MDKSAFLERFSIPFQLESLEMAPHYRGRAFDNLFQKDVQLCFNQALDPHKLQQINHLKHPFIQEYLGNFSLELPNGRVHHVSVLEYPQHDNMNQFIKNHFPPESTFYELFKDILKALIFLHQNGIVYRLLSARKILVFVEGSRFFGKLDLMPLISNLKTYEKDTAGTIFAPPEAFLHREVTAKADTWLMAAVIYELFSGEYPLDHVSSRLIANFHELLEEIPLPYQEFLEQSLMIEPSERLDSRQMLSYLETGTGIL